MANNQHIMIVITIALIFIAMKPQLSINAQQEAQVPCFFAFGDSLFDGGNNNNLITTAKANYNPYGIDYFYGPTGRFSNGFVIADLLPSKIGLTRVPPYGDAAGSNAILRGLNYASTMAGILDETGSQVGQRYSINQQLRNHQETVNQIATLLGNQTIANNLLQKCLYVVSNIGNEDYANNYFSTPISLARILFTPEKFAEKLIYQHSQQIRSLYNLGARKVAIFGVAPLGCIPRFLHPSPTNGSACDESINDAVRIFNTKLSSLVTDLNTNLRDANFTYINAYKFLEGNFSNIGIIVPNKACCQVDKMTGFCTRNGATCSNRNVYMYFDEYHPTEVVHKYITDRAYMALTPSDAIPVDIKNLIQN